jgi:hypothetical protein
MVQRPPSGRPPFKWGISDLRAIAAKEPHRETALTKTEVEKEKAIDDPTRAFNSPREVVESELSRDEKIKILQSWELDARRLLESAEENMTGGEKDRLPEVLKALRELGAGG